MWDTITARLGNERAKALKVAGIFTLALLVLFVALSALSGVRMGNGLNSSYDMSFSESAPNMPMGAPAGMYDDGYGGMKLSTRNAVTSMPPVPGYGYGSGDTEAFEVKNYSIDYETRNLESVCGTVVALKTRTDVVFENTNEYDRGCSYTFKVENRSVDEVLGILKGLDPKNLSENVYTIKQEVDDYTSEIEIYEKKLASIEATLSEALASYESITELSRKTGDTASLAKIIESKLMLIERLTSARLDTASQLDRMARAKAESLDRLSYTHFYVGVTENTYIDTEALVDSWKTAVKQLVWETNGFIEDLTVGLAGLLFLIVKIGLYGIIILIAIKAGWRFVKGTWTS